ncbi:MAG: LON peptidase substrate-binding domain-containing protein [Gammaproteobacteria bacterium]|nr:LON peptidase substrate-binding domain-containing protein [Gammaproteobacteria bacterium]
MDQTGTIALFPLHAVLFPGGTLPLRVFERRYVDMVRNCLRADEPFGVVLIRAGAETGTAAEPEAIGTTARIQDFDRGDDGLLNILAVGEQRFRILDREVLPNALQRARMELLAEPDDEIPEKFHPLVALLREALHRTGVSDAQATAQLRDAAWVGYRLAEGLPLPPRIKQTLLELHTPCDRIARIAELLQQAEQLPVAH